MECELGRAIDAGEEARCPPKGDFVYIAAEPVEARVVSPVRSPYQQAVVRRPPHHVPWISFDHGDATGSPEEESAQSFYAGDAEAADTGDERLVWASRRQRHSFVVAGNHRS
jgi:hypothetical protein